MPETTHTSSDFSSLARYLKNDWMGSLIRFEKLKTPLLFWLGLCVYVMILLVNYEGDALGLIASRAKFWILFGLQVGLILLLGLPLLQFVFKNRFKFCLAQYFVLLIIVADTLSAFTTTSYNPFFGGSAVFYYSGLVLLLYHLISQFEGSLITKFLGDLKGIFDHHPMMARCIEKNQETEKAAHELKIGDRVSVLPGEIIPCDGIIVQGTTSVDESSLLSETAVFLKNKGDFVAGASLNRDGPILVEVTQNLSDHFLQHRSRVLEVALSQLPPLQNFIFYFYLLAFLVLGLAVVGLTLLREESLGLYPILILVFATFGFMRVHHLLPVSFLIGLVRLYQNGVSVKSTNILLKIYRLKELFFDKTGTLTKGKYHFSQTFLEQGVNQGEFLSNVFSLEKLADHPLAVGVQTHPWYAELSPNPVEGFEKQNGLGISGTILFRGDRNYFCAVGNQRFLKRFQMYISRALRDKIEELESIGETVILCGWDGRAKGLMSFSDSLRFDTNPFFVELKKLGIRPSIMTGDHEQMLTHLKYMYGIEQVYTRCLPEEKIKKLDSDHKKHMVGFVADPLEEDRVFKAADVGIILGLGTNLQSRDVDVLILGRRLDKLIHLLKFSNRTLAVIKMGLIGGFALGAGILLLAASQLLAPFTALLLLGLSSLMMATLPLYLKNVEI